MSSLQALGRLFSQDKIIEDRTLNRLGAQALRTVVAHGLYRARPLSVAPETAEHVKQLRRDGLLVLRDFLPAGEFELVRKEAKALDRGEYPQTIRDGWTCRHTIPIRDVEAERVPAVRRFLEDPRLGGILSAAEQRPLNALVSHCDLEILVYDDSERLDTQVELHSDTFFNTHKAWFYLDDVTERDGPFAYIKGSNRLTARRLGYIYRDSFLHADDASPSRRITDAERDEHEPETVVVCPANTLIVANTCGYHRRLRGEPGRKRMALAFFLRTNPFAPHGLHSALARHPTIYGWLRSARGLLRR